MKRPHLQNETGSATNEEKLKETTHKNTEEEEKIVNKKMKDSRFRATLLSVARTRKSVSRGSHVLHSLSLAPLPEQ